MQDAHVITYRNNTIVTLLWRGQSFVPSFTEKASAEEWMSNHMNGHKPGDLKLLNVKGLGDTIQKMYPTSKSTIAGIEHLFFVKKEFTSLRDMSELCINPPSGQRRSQSEDLVAL
jgi:hypothetical protein